MEILILAFLALAFVLTFCVIALKLLWLGGKLIFGLLVLPFKLLGALVGGAAELAALPFKLFAFFLVLAAIVVGVILIPLLIPVFVIFGLVIALASAC